MFKGIPGGKGAGCFKEDSSVWLAISVGTSREGHAQWDELAQRSPREGEPGPTVWILLMENLESIPWEVRTPLCLVFHICKRKMTAGARHREAI